MIGLAVGLSRNSPSIFVTSDPDGTLTAPKGTMATDTSTGVVWQNTNGATEWDAMYIPPGMGTTFFSDLSIADGLNLSTLGAAVATIGAETGRPALRSYSMSAALTDGGAVFTRQDGLVLGGGKIRVRVNCRIATLSNGTNNLIVRGGPHDATIVGDVTDGVWLEYDLAGNSSGNWFLCSADNGTRTRTNTGIAATASSGAMTTLQVDINAAGTSATGRVNGVAVATPVVANIPLTPRTTALVNWLAYKQLGAGALTATVDYLYGYQVFSAAR